jgi:hypothetical protein
MGLADSTSDGCAGGAASRSAPRAALHHRVATVHDQRGERRTVGGRVRLLPRHGGARWIAWPGCVGRLSTEVMRAPSAQGLSPQRASAHAGGRTGPGGWHALAHRDDPRGEQIGLELDPDEARSRPGWHHHITLCILAHHLPLRSCQRVKKSPSADLLVGEVGGRLGETSEVTHSPGGVRAGPAYPETTPRSDSVPSHAYPGRPEGLVTKPRCSAKEFCS